MCHHKTSDEDLLASVAAGNLGALGELVRRHQNKVMTLSYRYLGSWDLAEDIAQETFLKVCQSAKRYHPSAKFTTWLYRIVVNLCIDHLRREKRRNRLLRSPRLGLAIADPPDCLELNEHAERVRKAVTSLPERQRQAVILHRYQELSHAEIAQITGWSKSTVESLLVRAYKTLRKLLAEFK